MPPEQPSTPRGAATRRRILDAAAEEFARHGIAGARVERVVRAARTNKAQLYGYFGNKDGLFDATFDDSLDRLTTFTPFDADDLADWAVRLYDEYLLRPDLVRLATWARLERRPAGHLIADVHRWDGPKRDALARAQAEGRVCAGDPSDLLAMVIAMSLTWSPAGTVYAATADEPDAAHEPRRALLRECVTRALAPPTTGA